MPAFLFNLLLFLLQTFVDPSLTSYEAETQKMMSAKEERPDVPESATRILHIIETYKYAEHHEKLVVTCIYFLWSRSVNLIRAHAYSKK